MKQALEIVKAKLGEDDLQVVYTLHELGVCLRDAKRYDEAEELLRQASEIEKAKLGENDLQVAYTLHELGVHVWNAKRYDEAEELLRPALEKKRQSWAWTISRSHIRCNRSACAYGTQSGTTRRRRC